MKHKSSHVLFQLFLSSLQQSGKFRHELSGREQNFIPAAERMNARSQIPQAIRQMRLIVLFKALARKIRVTTDGYFTDEKISKRISAVFLDFLKRIDDIADAFGHLLSFTREK